MKKSKPPGNTSRPNKEKYHLSKITKPQSAHFAYSIYFREPGGNHLEIEYYNPGGAQHGRAHTAGHWEKPLADERFSERGYLPQAFTHGTLQCDDIERSRRFYTEVLGLEILAGFNNAQYIKHASAPWYIVVLKRTPAPVSRTGEPIHFANGFSRAQWSNRTANSRPTARPPASPSSASSTLSTAKPVLSSATWTRTGGS